MSWLETIHPCIEPGLVVYESGQGFQRENVRLESSLAVNALWYRHRDRVPDGVLARLKKLGRLDRFDADAGNPPAWVRSK